MLNVRAGQGRLYHDRPPRVPIKSGATPLRPGTTYAVILASGITSGDVDFEADADMSAMLAAARPRDADLGAAWDAYAPLRAYLAHEDAKLGAERVVAAAVFTTQQVDDVLPALRAAVRATPVPEPTQLTLCDGAATSPCDDGLTGDDHVRGCFAPTDDVWELHLRLPMAKVQSGARPYLHPDDGGDVSFDPDGRPVLHGTEDVCVSLTVPKRVAMPEAGWPLAIYGHGTGGTFRSSVRDAGAPLSAVSLDANATVGVAVVGWDGPMHGERRGSDLDPEGLFYNFANPLAARGNLYQGATDVYELVRAFEGLVISAADSPTGQEIRFDAAHIAHIGHSQGATTGPLASPYEPGIGLNVWSGAGAGLIQSLLAKTEPVNVPQAVAVALQEFSDTGLGAVSASHPVMGLIQGLFDPLDPLNHASRELRAPPEGTAPQHVLHVYGLGDSYTPPATIETFARLLGVQQAEPLAEPVGGLATVTPPVRGNRTSPAGAVTGVLIQTRPAGYDGHFVMFRDAPTRTQFAKFVASWVADGAPTLYPR